MSKPAKQPKKLSGGSQSYREVTDSSLDRANVLYVAPADSRLYLSAWTRKAVVQKVQWCRQNFGIVQEWGRGIARHSVGKGISASFATSNPEWNTQAGKALERYLLTPSMCDVTGRRNAYEMQAHIVEQLAIIGESFVLHSENPDFPSPVQGVGDCPAFYVIDPNDVQTPTNELFSSIHDGVEIGDFNRAIRYHVKLADGKFASYDSRDISHLFYAEGSHQGRGVSPLAPGVNNLVDIHELKRLETKSAKVQRLVSLVLKGTKSKKGRGAFAALQDAPEGTDQIDTSAIENLYQGTGAAIARMGEDGGVELISGNTPSPLVNEYVTDLLLRDAAAPTGVPVEFFWKNGTGGTEQRAINAKADAAFSMYSDKVIYGWFERTIIRYIEWRIASGLLPEGPADWRENIVYRRPRRVTVDTGRDSKARIEELNNGLATMQSIYDEQGEDYLPKMRQWIQEFREFERIAVEQGYSEQEAKQLAQRWRPLPPGSAMTQPAQPEPTKPAEPMEAEDSPEDTTEDTAENDTNS